MRRTTTTCRIRISAAEELELVAAARAGDQTARDRIVESQTPWVYKIVSQFRRPSDPDFDDYLQEGFVGLLQSLQTFDPNRQLRFGTYATGGIRFALLRLFSKRKRSREFPANPQTFDRDLAGENNQGEERVEDSELLGMLQRSLASLPERSREVVQARLAGEILSAIGARLGITKERVRQIETRAKTKLKELMGAI